MGVHRRATLGLAGLLFTAMPVTASWALSDAEALENRIKAAFVCKFPNYVEWPASAFARADSPLVLGVIGTNAEADELRLQPKIHAVALYRPR